MGVYLNDVPLEVAQEKFLDAMNDAGLNRIIGIEQIPLVMIWYGI